MKQNITHVQLNELSDEQKELLREWWKPKGGDCYYYPKINSTGNVPCGYRNWETDDMKTRVLPLLSIGQMLDILHARNNKFGNHYIDFNWDGELVDALWEEVKQYI